MGLYFAGEVLDVDAYTGGFTTCRSPSALHRGFCESSGNDLSVCFADGPLVKGNNNDCRQRWNGVGRDGGLSGWRKFQIP